MEDKTSFSEMITGIAMTGAGNKAEVEGLRREVSDLKKIAEDHEDRLRYIEKNMNKASGVLGFLEKTNILKLLPWLLVLALGASIALKDVTFSQKSPETPSASESSD